LALCALAALFFALVSHAEAVKEVSLAWDPNTDADVSGYHLYYGTASGNYAESVDVGRRTNARVPNLQEGETYYFVVKAYNSEGVESLPSNEATFTSATSVDNGHKPVSFPDYRGSYSGSIVQGAGGTNAFISLDLSSSGSFTGRILLGSVASTLRGKLSAEGDLMAPFTSARQPRSLALHLDTTTGNIVATLSTDSGDLPVTLSASPFSRLNTTTDAGKYTMALGTLVPAAGSTENFPQGTGYATITISADGAIRGGGKLADGQAFSVSSKLKADAHFDVYSLVYKRSQGILAGPIQLRDTPGVSDADGSLFWTKPQQKTGRYRAGFSGTVTAALSVWHKVLLAQASRDVSAPTTARAVLSGGDLPAPMNPLQKELLVGQRNSVVVLNPGPDRLQLKIQSASGLIRGTYVHPVDNRVRSVQGVVLLKQGLGAGFFTGLNQTGPFELIGVGGE
jgi:hypothetical protein